MRKLCTKNVVPLWIILAAMFLLLPSNKNLLAQSGKLSHKEREISNWAPGTKAAIDSVIKKNAGNKSAYAVFDWDNTSIYADVQDNLFIYQLENLAFKMTPGEFRYSFTHYTDTGYKENLLIPSDNFVSPYVNVDGKPININLIAEDCYNDYKYFYENYRKINPKSVNNLSLDKLKQTDQFKDFKAKMWFTYSAIEDSFSPNAAYTWVMYVTYPGFTSEEVKKMVKQAMDWGIKRESKKVYFDSPASLLGKAGAVSNTNAGNYFCNTIRPTHEMGLLFKELEKNNVHTYICTASMQEIIETVATTPKYGYNLPQHHVLGLRLVKDAGGKFLPKYDISGGYTINSMAGKAVNINKILGAKYHANPVMIGGDSDGDYYMMTQLSGLAGEKMINDYKPLQLILVVNRIKGGKIGKICKIAADQLAGESAGATTVVLQGRDENMGAWIPTEKTLKLGKSGTENLKLLP
jgi:phosphoserine phosphatase